MGSYAVIPLSEKVRLGMAINGIWGGSVEYDTGWAGRAFVTEATLIGMNFEPSISWRPVEWFGIGVGLNIVYANLNMKFRPGPVALNNRYEIHNADDWGFGGTLGLMFEPVKGTRIGIKYNSHVKLDLKGRAKLGAMGKYPVDIAMELPQGVNVSLYHEINEQLAILADVGWYDWSKFGTMPSTLGVIPLPIDRKWRDTWRVGLGAQYQINDNWLVRGGWSYDSSPVKDHYRYPDLPISDVNRISIGAEYKINETLTIGADYTLGIMGDTNVDDVALPPANTTVLKGRYRPALMHFFAVTMRIRF